MKHKSVRQTGHTAAQNYNKFAKFRHCISSTKKIRGMKRNYICIQKNYMFWN